MFKRNLLFSLLLISSKAIAQYYQTGVEPFSTKWGQIKTNSFRIIFPIEAEEIAFRYANLLSVINTITPNTLNSKQKPFDIVVHNHSVLSNGFVAWAPKRMEIIAQPPTSTYAQPWLTQLALHETRHTSQIYKLDGGVFNPASILFGEQIIGLAAGFVPSWYFEGDAVAFETATSNSGRGRQSDFYQYYRAHYLTHEKRFNYDKWLMGSFKDNIPNHYSLGYQLVSFVKIKYGDKVWANTLTYVSRYPFTFFPFYFGLKKQTGLSRKRLFEETFSQLDSIWAGDQKNNMPDKVTSMVEESKEYTDYRYPYLVDDSTLISYKKSLSKTPSFVLIDTRTKKERVLFQPGYLTSIPSFNKGNIFWTEYKPNVRWEYLNYSIIKWYSLSRGEIKMISDKGRYFSPVYRPNDGLIYSISGKNDGNNSIDAFDLSGKKVKSVFLPTYYQPFELVVSTDQNVLLLAVVSDKGKSIVSLNDDGKYVLVFGPTYLDIHSLSAYGNLIFFSTSNGYKEDLFALNVETKEVNQLTNSAFGSTDPYYSAKSNRIVFSNFTSKGYKASVKEIDLTTQSIKLPETNDNWISKRLSYSEKFNVDSVSIPINSYKVEKYHGIKTLMNIHSWAPFYFDPNQITIGEVNVKPGLTVFSQNLTGSSVLTAGYGYDKSSLVRINYQYYGFFPVLSYQFDLSDNSATIYYAKNTTVPKINEQKKESTFSIYLPLKLSASSYSTIFYPIFQIVNNNNYLFSIRDSLYHKGFNRFNFRIYFSSLKQQALMDVRPRLGFTANIEIKNAPFNKNNLGSLYAGIFNLYIPGVGPNHSILVNSSLQNQVLKRFPFSNVVVFPRGCIEKYSELYRSISFEYLMPVAYPDFAFGSLAYLKRISLNTFYDFAQNKDPYKAGKPNDYMKSFGFEIFADIKLLRTRYPIRFKFQQGWSGDNHLSFNSFGMMIDFYGQ